MNHELMGDNLAANSGYLPKKRALHPNYGGINRGGSINRDEVTCDDQTPNTQAFSHTKDVENSLTISTQERHSLQGSHSSQSIFRDSNPNRRHQFAHQAHDKSLEIQSLVHRFSALLNDSMRIAETAYSVVLLDTQMGVLFQAKKIAQVRTIDLKYFVGVNCGDAAAYE